MQTKLNPYLNFKSNARQAMEFYKSVFGGKLQLTTFKEFHASTTPEEDDLIMHAELNAGEACFSWPRTLPRAWSFIPGRT